MIWSKTVISTLRNDPQEAEIKSHKLMLRAGLIKKVSAGLYTFMPLGLRALRKVEKIIREEMDNAGASEILMPALQPKELWEQSKRYSIMGDTMYRLKDRQKREFILGPTHEEVITDLASKELHSYRQLPKTFYQIQTKFRDEIRPRFGLMRAKEFIMKDAYSFDATEDDANKSYQAMYDAYVKIFKRCGLKVKVVEADTGAMGGNWSHEFMVLADSGEDGIVECTSCSYAANLEKAERAIKNTPAFPDSEKLPTTIDTPGMKTIDEVAGFLNCHPKRLVKTLIYMIDDKPIAIICSGDRDVNEFKLSAYFSSSNIELASDEIIEKVTGGPVGFCGPVGLDIPIYADIGLRNYKGAITGANKKDQHLLNFDINRDAKISEFIDLTFAHEGDTCPRCNGKLQEKRGIEVGHVFKLGKKYTEAFNAEYLDDNGNSKTMIMGCYGIGVTRTLQSIIEQSNDENGIIWPNDIAPYKVAVLCLDPNEEEIFSKAKSIMNSLISLGIDTILDDRDERPGVKFKDADLIGFPIRVIVSKRSIKEDVIELKLRTDKGKGSKIKLENAVNSIQEILSVSNNN